MDTIRPQDLNFILSRTPKDIREMMKESRVYLAGGFIRATIAGEKPSDIDLFGQDGGILDNLSVKLALDRKGRRYVSDNAITVLAPPRFPVQFITRWLYSNHEDLVKSFDFTICQACIWWNADTEKWGSLISDDFYPDLAARRLVYTYPQREEAAGGSMMRVRKFLTRGYSIQAPSLAGVISRLVGAVRDSDHHDEQSRSQIIAGLLHEVDPLVVVDGVDFIDEHQVTKEA